MGGGPSPPTPSNPCEQLKNQIRLMFAYTKDRYARLSIIQSILKKNQEHALPPKLSKDLILEAKVRAGKQVGRPKQSPLATWNPFIVPPSSDHEKLFAGDHANSSTNTLRTTTLRVEKEYGQILSDEEMVGLEKQVAGDNETSFGNNHSKELILNISGQPTKWSSLFKKSTTN